MMGDNVEASESQRKGPGTESRTPSARGSRFWGNGVRFLYGEVGISHWNSVGQAEGESLLLL